MAGRRRSFGAPKAPRPDGQIRQSQLVMTFGPGAMVDLVDRSVVVGGLEHWSYGPTPFVALDDERLRRSLVPRLKALDADLDLATENYFRMPPECDLRDPTIKAGVRALEFPRWFVCHGCRKLARASDQFEDKGGRYRHQCSPNLQSHAVPVRFVAACVRGHLADFPWISFAHEAGACERPDLYLREGATGDVARIFVECTNCGSARPLSQARVLPFDCQGDRPWLGGRGATEKCGERLELLVRTATNAYFAQVVSALRLPLSSSPDELTLRLQEADVWKAVQKVTKVEQLQMLAELQDVVASAITGHSLEKVLAAIQRARGTGDSLDEKPLRTAEFEKLAGAPDETPGLLAPRGVQFAAYRIPPARADLPEGLSRLVIVPELREVRVQVSFSRFDSISANVQGEYDFAKARVKPAVLTLPSGNEKWLPAAEVRGEGLFVELDPDAVIEWQKRPAVVDRADMLRRALAADGVQDDELDARFFLVHSLSHLLLTAIALECGYAASSIRERIYCLAPGADGRARTGLLLSTGTTGAEGTLGGLVEEGRRIRHHLREAWDLGRLCSNDPVCASHDPSGANSDRRLEGAACHGCLYVAETCCERFNRFLDRALVVPTIGNPEGLAFFPERP